jgi:hypothetical protein
VISGAPDPSPRNVGYREKRPLALHLIVGYLSDQTFFFYGDEVCPANDFAIVLRHKLRVTLVYIVTQKTNARLP